MLGLSTEVIKEGENTILKVNCENLPSILRLEDKTNLTIDRLADSKSITRRLILLEERLRV